MCLSMCRGTIHTEPILGVGLKGYKVVQEDRENVAGMNRNIFLMSEEMRTQLDLSRAATGGNVAFHLNLNHLFTE